VASLRAERTMLKEQAQAQAKELARVTEQNLVSAFRTVVDDAAFCGPAGEFVLAREPHSEIAALDEGQRQPEEIVRMREELALAHGRMRELELDCRVRRT